MTRRLFRATERSEEEGREGREEGRRNVSFHASSRHTAPPSPSPSFERDDGIELLTLVHLDLSLVDVIAGQADQDGILALLSSAMGEKEEWEGEEGGGRERGQGGGRGDRRQVSSLFLSSFVDINRSGRSTYRTITVSPLKKPKTSMVAGLSVQTELSSPADS